MKIELIHPSVKNTKGFPGGLVYKHECLTLATLAGYIPNKHQIKITDELVGSVNFNSNADVIALTINSFNALRSYEIAQKFKVQGRKVIAGGIHATVCPHEVKQYVDAVVVGEGDILFPRVIGDIEAGDLKPFYHNDAKVPLDGLPGPRYDLLKQGAWPMRVVQTSRGCPFNCDFCSIKFMYGRGVRYRNAGQIIKTIEESPFTYLYFSDDNFYMIKEHSAKIMKGMIGLKKRFFAQVSANAGDDQSWLDLALQAGCACVCIGFESIDEQGLKGINKSHNKVSRYKNQIKHFRERGIGVIGSFMFGFDNAPADIFERTLDFILDTDIDYVSCTALTPFPGTALYQRLKKQGRLFHDQWWLTPNYWYNMHYEPEGPLAAAQIEEKIFWLLKEAHKTKYFFKKLRSLPDTLTWRDKYLYFWGHLLHVFFNKDRRKKSGTQRSPTPVY